VVKNAAKAMKEITEEKISFFSKILVKSAFDNAKLTEK
tara:strand:- start:7980 stop:8093 length:114 start_codon:yes stop_codon:yes gene_type:complete